MEHDLEASFVDDHVVVEPAEDDQLALVGSTTFRPWGEMVDLESSAAGAAVGSAGESDLGKQCPLESRRCRALSAAVVHIPAVFTACDDLCFGITEEGLQSLLTHTWPGFEHYTRFTICLGGLLGIDHHRNIGRWWIVGDETSH